jgi:hypothetical protein
MKLMMRDISAAMLLMQRGDEKCFCTQLLLKRDEEKCFIDSLFSTRGDERSLAPTV